MSYRIAGQLKSFSYQKVSLSTLYDPLHENQPSEHSPHGETQSLSSSWTMIIRRCGQTYQMTELASTVQTAKCIQVKKKKKEPIPVARLNSVNEVVVCINHDSVRSLTRRHIICVTTDKKINQPHRNSTSHHLPKNKTQTDRHTYAHIPEKREHQNGYPYTSLEPTVHKNILDGRNRILTKVRTILELSTWPSSLQITFQNRPKPRLPGASCNLIICRSEKWDLLWINCML